jgi:Transposase and inactivated derivatives
METVTITKAEYDRLIGEQARLERQVEYLLEQMRLSRHRQFGASSEKSEYDLEQLNLFNEAEVMVEPAPELELVEIEKHYRRAKRSAADRLPEDLPVEVIEYTLPENEQVCCECGGGLHIMGHESRRELKIIPAQATIVEHRRAVYSCRCCEATNDHVPIPKAEMPKPVISGSFASPEAVAHIMSQKFVLSVPLYRQEQEFLRSGILLSRQTMSNWMLRCAQDWLAPVYERLKGLLLEHDVLHSDETTLQVLREPGKTAQSKSYMWLYRTSGDTEHPVVLYDYQPSRKAEHPARFLEGWRGYLHADGYEGYHRLPDDMAVVGCWAHLRRKFDEALKIVPTETREDSLAFVGKRYCDKLFELERDFADLSPEQRCEKRTEISKPLMEAFFAWADSCGALPKNPVGKAVHYAQSQRKYLERYLLDGRLEISNNRAERSIKPFVIGRKNWLFANTPRGAKASAVIYSVIETAKENGLKPYDYLKHIFRTAPNLNLKNPDQWDLLMPHYFKTTAKA